MKVHVNSISGIDDALVALHISKRHLTEESENGIRKICCICVSLFGELESHEQVIGYKDEPLLGCTRDMLEQSYTLFHRMLEKLCKYGQKHITLLKFIDISVTVYGLHRAGQDDWDSHAKRFDNRIVRESTRLAEFGESEKSAYYADKILTTEEVLKALGIELPENYTDENGRVWVKEDGGYVAEEMTGKQDVRRGLYRLCIPSTFIFKVNLAEWAHVYRERCAAGNAHPEVKELAEKIQDAIERAVPMFNREWLAGVTQ